MIPDGMVSARMSLGDVSPDGTLPDEIILARLMNRGLNPLLEGVQIVRRGCRLLAE
jgi:hypothetical protein